MVTRTQARGSNVVSFANAVCPGAERSNCSVSTYQLAESDLARSGLTLVQAEEVGLFAVDNASAINPDFAPAPAIVIPYYDQEGRIVTYQRSDTTVPFCRVRYIASSGTPLPRSRKYDQPGGSGTKPYFPRDWAGLAQARKDQSAFVIVEGVTCSPDCPRL